jgi:peptidyl-tRNA hydrolase, PTH1 family
MFYIVGLGNPGAQYAKTRHNIGWVALDVARTAWEMPEPKLVKKYESEIVEGEVLGEEVMLVYPQTFMNSSGVAVRKLVPKDERAQIILVYDEVDLPVGQVKISYGNGAAGHNGVASVIEQLGTKDFVRVRIGVAQMGIETGVAVRPTSEELANYVLGKVSPSDASVYKKILPQVVEMLEVIIKEGKERAMNRFN